MPIFYVDVAKAGTGGHGDDVLVGAARLPDPDDDRCAALGDIGVAGMSWMMQATVIATSGRAVEAAATSTSC